MLNSDSLKYLVIFFPGEIHTHTHSHTSFKVHFLLIFPLYVFQIIISYLDQFALIILLIIESTSYHFNIYRFKATVKANLVYTCVCGKCDGNKRFQAQ